MAIVMSRINATKEKKQVKQKYIEKTTNELVETKQQRLNIHNIRKAKMIETKGRKRTTNSSAFGKKSAVGGFN